MLSHLTTKKTPLLECFGGLKWNLFCVRDSLLVCNFLKVMGKCIFFLHHWIFMPPTSPASLMKFKLFLKKVLALCFKKVGASENIMRNAVIYVMCQNENYWSKGHDLELNNYNNGSMCLLNKKVYFLVGFKHTRKLWNQTFSEKLRKHQKRTEACKKKTSLGTSHYFYVLPNPYANFQINLITWNI